MHTHSYKRILIAGNLIVLAIVLIAAAWVYHLHQAALEEELRSDISTQEARLSELASLTDRNTADETVQEIISDCADRGRFEELISRLGSLERAQLLEAQRLFASCGDFHAVQKNFMVSRLERESSVLKNLAELLATLSEDPTAEDRANDWERYASLEAQRAALMSEEVAIQESIMTELIKGTSVQSGTVSELSGRAQNIGEQLQVLDRQIDSLRLSLTDS